MYSCHHKHVGVPSAASAVAYALLRIRPSCSALSARDQGIGRNRPCAAAADALLLSCTHVYKKGTNQMIGSTCTQLSDVLGIAGLQKYHVPRLHVCACNCTCGLTLGAAAAVVVSQNSGNMSICLLPNGSCLAQCGRHVGVVDKQVACIGNSSSTRADA